MYILVFIAVWCWWVKCCWNCDLQASWRLNGLALFCCVAVLCCAVLSERMTCTVDAMHKLMDVELFCLCSLRWLVLCFIIRWKFSFSNDGKTFWRSEETMIIKSFHLIKSNCLPLKACAARNLCCVVFRIWLAFECVGVGVHVNVLF